MEYTTDKMLTWVGHAFTTVAAAGFGSTAFVKFAGEPNVLASVVSDPVFAPLTVGLLVAGGLYLRDYRARKLVPVRCQQEQTQERPYTYSGLE